MYDLIQQNIPMFSILLFVLFYIGILSLKPAFLYNSDGSLRQFGIGFSKKTIFPAWLLSIGLAIMSYFLIFYYTSLSRV
jgi:hypothetical protein